MGLTSLEVNFQQDVAQEELEQTKFEHVALGKISLFKLQNMFIIHGCPLAPQG